MSYIDFNKTRENKKVCSFVIDKSKKTKSSCLKKSLALFRDKSGFMSILLMALSVLILTGIIGVSLLSIGIKNITAGQSICIQTGLEGQKKLALLLKKILQLNNTVRTVDNSRKAIEAAIVSALSSGMLYLIPGLNKKLELVKQTQNTLISKQKLILGQSQPVRIETFKKLKKRLKKLNNVFKVSKKHSYPKALALKKEKIGDRAYIYQPKRDFSSHQKSQFLWEMNPFYPLSKSLKRIIPAQQTQTAVYSCSVSLEKRERQWIETLYH